MGGRKAHGFFFGMNMNIVLIGYRCTGKSSVGKLLESELEKHFADTDEMIEDEADYGIDEIVRKKGWDFFRSLEKDIIEKISLKNDLIISTGGGVVLDERNINNLKKNGYIIWLKATADIIKDRMAYDPETGHKRPSLTGRDPLQEIKDVLEIREKYYKAAADFEVDTSNIPVEIIADLIIGALPDDVV